MDDEALSKFIRVKGLSVRLYFSIIVHWYKHVFQTEKVWRY